MLFCEGKYTYFRQKTTCLTPKCAENGAKMRLFDGKIESPGVVLCQNAAKKEFLPNICRYSCPFLAR
jgi:hypothetical protein